MNSLNNCVSVVHPCDRQGFEQRERQRASAVEDSARKQGAGDAAGAAGAAGRGGAGVGAGARPQQLSSSRRGGARFASPAQQRSASEGSEGSSGYSSSDYTSDEERP